MTEQATNAASTATSTVTTAASGVADNVFSMFGGGAKKEKKDDEEDRGENSGSAKAQAAKAAEENPEANKPRHAHEHLLTRYSTGRGTRIRGCSLRARHPPHRESRSQDQRGA